MSIDLESQDENVYWTRHVIRQQECCRYRGAAWPAAHRHPGTRSRDVSCCRGRDRPLVFEITINWNESDAWCGQLCHSRVGAFDPSTNGLIHLSQTSGF